MPRIVYLAFPTGQVSGGQKMILRHVETLRALGFDAVVRINGSNRLPPGFAHHAPVEVATPFRPDDVLVVPSDAPNALQALGRAPQRAVVFCQAHVDFAAIGYDAVAAWPAEKPLTVLAVSPTSQASVRRAFPQADVRLVPAFADERVFRPGAAARPRRVAAIPRKRPLELRAIRGRLARVHARHAQVPWTVIDGAAEADVARALAESAVMLSLSRMEALGMTPLEAMASGALVAGFPGVGGRDFATEDNGFWAPDDDVEAAADAVAQALDVVLAAGPELARRQAAGYATAARWSHAAFVPVLERTWTELAPDTQTLSRRERGRGEGGPA